MQTITTLTAQKRNKERVNVFLDGQYSFSLALMTAAYLRVGQTLTDAEIAGLQEKDSLEKAKQSALRFIGYRPRSIAEVRQNLTKKGYEEPVAEQVVARLQELNLLDDRAFAQFWVEQRESFKPRSQLALRQELYQKGVDRTIIDEVVAGVDEIAAARRAGQIKARTLTGHTKEDFFKKMAGYLQRRGFNYGIVKTITQELWETTTSSETE